MINLSFQGKGRKLQRLNLALNGDAALQTLAAQIPKLSGGEHDYHSDLDMVVTPLKGKNLEPQTYPLGEDEFDDFWGAIVEFVRENRLPERTKQPEFLLDIR